MTARKAIELAAIILLPGALLYSAFVFVSLETNIAQWTAGWRATLVYLWFASSFVTAGLWSIGSKP